MEKQEERLWVLTWPYSQLSIWTLERSGWEESREVGLRCLRDPESVEMLSQAGDNTAQSEDTSLTRRVTQGRRSILGEKGACKNKDGWHGFSHITWHLGKALGCTESF